MDEEKFVSLEVNAHFPKVFQVITPTVIKVRLEKSGGWHHIYLNNRDRIIINVLHLTSQASSVGILHSRNLV